VLPVSFTRIADWSVALYDEHQQTNGIDGRPTKAKAELAVTEAISEVQVASEPVVDDLFKQLGCAVQQAEWSVG